jgi:hypothetical protein
MGPIGCPESSVQNYHWTLRNIPEQHRSQGNSRLFDDLLASEEESAPRSLVSELIIIMRHRDVITRNMFTTYPSANVKCQNVTYWLLHVCLSVCLSLCPHATTREKLNGMLWHVITRGFIKLCLDYQFGSNGTIIADVIWTNTYVSVRMSVLNSGWLKQKCFEHTL